MIGWLQQSKSNCTWLTLQYNVQHDVTNPSYSLLYVLYFRLFWMLSFSSWWLRPSHVNWGEKRGPPYFPVATSDRDGPPPKWMCGERRVDSKGLTWTSVWKLMSDPLALPNDTARKGGLLAAEGGYHYVSETESGGRWVGVEGWVWDWRIWRQPEGNCGFRSKRQKCLSCWLASEPQ